MNEYIQENKRSLMLLVGMLIVLIIVLYFILLRPLLADLSSKERAITSIVANVELLEAQIANFDTDISDMDIEQLMLENKIPTERNLDEYILSLQKLEAMTGSKIESIDFVYDSSLAEIEETEEIEESSEETKDIDEEGNEEVAGSESGEIMIDPIIIKEKPEELQVMTVRLVAISPSYDDFIQLLKVIENQERVSIVTHLDFIQPTENDVYFSDSSSELIPFQAELTTFYYPN